MHENLEASLLRHAGALQRGEADAMSGLVVALKRVQPSDKNLGPILASLLKRPEQDAQVFAACALARLGDGALPHLDALISHMNTHQYPGSCAAASALGCVPSAKAVSALTSALDSFPTDLLPYVVSALKEQGAAATSALRALDRKARNSLTPDEACGIKDAAAHIRFRARAAHCPDALSLDVLDYILLTGYLKNRQSPADFFQTYKSDRQGPDTGLIFDDRFRYITNCKSECGLRVYRVDARQSIVVLTCDGSSYGMSPTNASEYLATAITHIFGLDPTRTIWLERYAKSSGQPDESCAVVHYIWNANQGVLSNPAWYHVKDFAGDLRTQYGIEW